MKRAYAICIGKENESWDDIQTIIQPCADYMLDKINTIISSLETSGQTNKSIKLAE